mmetsp:Transcript_4634/g.10182  ORF Transcript_4634/g.10182 Transcript_4634/m.10182 type:complete len:273 (-) Transcript_4634:787-1605(-)
MPRALPPSESESLGESSSRSIGAKAMPAPPPPLPLPPPPPPSPPPSRLRRPAVISERCCSAPACACWMACNRSDAVTVGAFFGLLFEALQLSTKRWSRQSVALSSALMSTSISSEPAPSEGMLVRIICTTLPRLLDVSLLMLLLSDDFSSKVISRSWLWLCCVSWFAADTIGNCDDCRAFLPPVAPARFAADGGGCTAAGTPMFMPMPALSVDCCISCIISICLCIIFICFLICFIWSSAAVSTGVGSALNFCSKMACSCVAIRWTSVPSAL